MRLSERWSQKKNQNPLSFTLHGRGGVCPFKLGHLWWTMMPLLNRDAVLFLAFFPLNLLTVSGAACFWGWFLSSSYNYRSLLGWFWSLHLTPHFTHQQWTHTSQEPEERAALLHLRSNGEGVPGSGAPQPRNHWHLSGYKTNSSSEWAEVRSSDRFFSVSLSKHLILSSERKRLVENIQVNGK